MSGHLLEVNDLRVHFPTEDGLSAWIRDPQAIDAHTAMPTLGVSETQARLMARYLLAH